DVVEIAFRLGRVLSKRGLMSFFDGAEGFLGISLGDRHLGRCVANLVGTDDLFTVLAAAIADDQRLVAKEIKTERADVVLRPGAIDVGGIATDLKRDPVSLWIVPIDPVLARDEHMSGLRVNREARR